MGRVVYLLHPRTVHHGGSCVLDLNLHILPYILHARSEGLDGPVRAFTAHLRDK